MNVLAFSGVLSAFWSLVLLNKGYFVDVLLGRKSLSLRGVVGLGGYDDFREELLLAACDYAEKNAGLVLDRDDPLSDASLANALSEKTGMAIRSVKSAAMIREDIGYAVAREIETETGVRLSNVFDGEALRADIAVYASGVLSAKTGIPITDISNTEQTKEEVREWATAMGALSEEIEQAVAVFKDSGVDVAALLEEGKKKYKINPRTGLHDAPAGVNVESAVAGLLSAMIASSTEKMVYRQRKNTKRTRRQEQNRRAQAAFRKSRGNRLQYQPIGDGGGGQDGGTGI